MSTLQQTFKKLEILHTVTTKSGSKELEDYSIKNNPFVAIEFPASYETLIELPDNLEYAIRFPAELRGLEAEVNPWIYNWHTDLLFPPLQFGGPRNFHSTHDGSPCGYNTQGFLFVQKCLYLSFLTVKNKMKIELEEFPDIFVRVSVENFRLKRKFQKIVKLF
jgi:hypothetical protein